MTVQPELDVLIVGGGPAGLAAAVELRRLGAGRVLVLEREAQAGGVPRHCHHTGFGWRDLRRLLSGPAYARKRLELLRQSGAELLPETAAVAWEGRCALRTVGPGGPRSLSARAVLLATGCRERPRAARMVPGSRPQGVLTTGSLQQLVWLRGIRPGRKAVVVGAEHVSFSAVQTLASAGVQVVAMVTELPRHQSYGALRWLTASRRGVPILTSSVVSRVRGRRRVEGVEVTSLELGSKKDILCDTVVFTGDWIPDHELARLGGLEMDPGTRGPRVDALLRTSVEGVFACGNLNHGAESADVAALEGRLAAASIHRYLREGGWFPAQPVPVSVRAPIKWVFPNALVPGQAPLARRAFVFRVERFLEHKIILASQGDRVLQSQAFSRLIPNRPCTLPFHRIAAAASGSAPVVLSML